MGGGSKSESKSEPVWPAGSQEMRNMLFQKYASQMRGEIDEGMYGRMRAETADAASIERERLLRAMGRTPGVAGPERHERLRRIQGAEIQSSAAALAQQRTQGFQQALRYSMQSPAQKSSQKTKGANPWIKAGTGIAAAGMGMGAAYLLSKQGQGSDLPGGVSDNIGNVT